MKGYLKRFLTNGVRRLIGLEDLKTRLPEAFDPVTWRMMLNEIASANQGVQMLLSRSYREMLAQKRPLPDLHETEFRCYSQNGEDGLLLYLFSLVGTTNRRAVEICCGNGVECNSANLVINHGWNALLVDGDEWNIDRGREFYSRCRDTFSAPPTLVAQWVTTDNVNDLVTRHGFAGEIDLFSLDMDGPDYWIWKALTCARPRAVLLEFNATWGPHRAETVPYRTDFRVDFRKYPWFCGASLSAFVKLGRERGYRLVGVHRLGFNALLLRDDTGVGLFPEVTPADVFARHPVLRNWKPDWMPPLAERPEWGEAVEV